MNFKNFVSMTILALCTLALVGCRSTDTRDSHDTALALPDDVRSVVRIFDRDGQSVDWSSMRASLVQADIIVIGETHGQAIGLEAAACIFDDVLADRSEKTTPALLLEFFERDAQLAIEDYLAGVTDEAAFRKASRRTAGNYPPGHARMLEAAKAAGAPVYAANAPRRYVRMTTGDGYEKLRALAPIQQSLFETPDPVIEGKYRDDFFGLMGGMSHGTPETEHGIPAAMIEKMYYSQQIWDATMADSVALAVGRGNRPAVLVIGRFHSDFDGGTVQLINRYAPSRSVVTLSMIASNEATIANEDLGRADFVVYTSE